MSRFYGPIGFAISKETFEGSGVWEDVVIEKKYRGDVIRNIKRWDNGEHLNSNLNVNNSISIVSDPYISAKLYAIKYVKWLGEYWTITSVDVQPPRMILSIGGVYNGPKADASGVFNEHPRIH